MFSYLAHGTVLLTLLPVELAARIAPLAADVIVLTVTWVQTYTLIRQSRRAGVRTNLGLVLLRDGMMPILFDSFIY